MRELLIIDPQIDFCSPDGALYVEGADQDMVRLAAMVASERFECERITVTMDQHVKHHIAHGICWKDSEGNHPDPFTTITAADVKNGKWTPLTDDPNSDDDLEWAIHYCEELERKGKYTLMIWPEHCLIGSPGACIYPALYAALQIWQSRNGKDVVWIPKGEDPSTEMYSAVKPEVQPEPDENWEDSELADLLEDTDCDDVLVAGEALSHCVKATVEDMTDKLYDSIAIIKLVLLTDATSPVTLAKEAADAFVKEMVEKGMRKAATVDYYRPIIKHGIE